MTDAKAHAAIGPSALSRLLACPGSHKLAQTVPPGGPGTIYAAEGTAAHHIAEMVLTGSAASADEFLGQVLRFDGFDVPVTDEMVEGVALYTDHCQSITPKSPSARYYRAVEQRVTLDRLWPNGNPPEPIFGTADFILADFDNDVLTVCDLKYGRGDVYPEENPQALAYALGAMLQLAAPIGTVDVCIVQPRGKSSRGVKTWRTSGVDLLLWGSEVLVPGVEAMLSPGAALSVGAHCGFCPAKAVCPALRDHSRKTARLDFGPLPPDAAALGDAELATVLDQAEVISEWIKAVRAEASSRLDRGAAIPGYKLVPKRAVRKWASEQAALAVVESYAENYLVPDLVKSVLVTPTQVEKKSPELYAELNELGLIDCSSSGTTLVADHDPRDALVQKNAKEQFSPVGPETP